jgi:hypothetical protein
MMCIYSSKSDESATLLNAFTYTSIAAQYRLYMITMIPLVREAHGAVPNDSWGGLAVRLTRHRHQRVVPASGQTAERLSRAPEREAACLPNDEKSLQTFYYVITAAIAALCCVE